MTVGQRIRDIRKENKLKQKIFGKSIGTTGANISKIEKDESLPSIRLIIAISDLYNVTTDYLLRGVTNDHNTVIDGINGNVSNSSIDINAKDNASMQETMGALKDTISAYKELIEHLRLQVKELREEVDRLKK